MLRAANLAGEGEERRDDLCLHLLLQRDEERQFGIIWEWKEKQKRSYGEDTSNTSKKGRDGGRGGGGRTCSVVNVSCKLRQECIMEV